MRTGVIAEKVGMMGLFQDNGDQLPVTVLRIDSTVVDTRTKEKDGYTAVQMGFKAAKDKLCWSNVHCPLHEVPPFLIRFIVSASERFSAVPIASN